MHTEQINRATVAAMIAFSLIALVTVLSAYLPGHPPQADEGTGAHIFQLSIVLLLPVGCVFLATADWTQPARNIRRLMLPGVAVVLSFAALYYLENVYYPSHYPPPPPRQGASIVDRSSIG